MPLCDICFIGQTHRQTQTLTLFSLFFVFSALQNGVTFQVIELKMAINKSRKFPLFFFISRQQSKNQKFLLFHCKFFPLNSQATICIGEQLVPPLFKINK